MSTLSRSSWGRVFDDLGVTLLEVAYGRIDVDQQIGGVVIHDPVDEPVYPQNAVVLAVALQDADALAALVTEAGGRDAVAVVVRASTELPDAVRDAADRAGVAILNLARGATWTQLAALLRSLLAEDDVGQTPAESLGGVSSGDLFAVANAIAALLDAPVTIEDRSSRVLAFSGGQERADPSRVETIIGRQVPDRYSRVLTEMGVFRALYRDDAPVVVDPVALGEGVSTQRVAIAVRAGDEVLGSIWAAMDGPLTEERAATLRDATKLVALHLLRIRAGADAQRRLRAELVSRAVNGGADAQDALGRLGLSGRRVWVTAAALAPRGGDGTEHDSIAERERLTDALALHLSAVQQGAAVALVGDTVYGILPVADAAAEERSVGLAEDFLHRVGDRIPAVIGVGRPAATVAEIARSRAEAHRALRVVLERVSAEAGDAHERADAGRRSVARISDVETESLLLDLRDLRSSRGDVASGVLARLIEYDARNDAHLVDTLTAWLDRFGDVTAAAAACFVHTNTFRYRLRRVAEVGGVDLDDPDVRFAVMLEIRTLPAR
ncbi:PucR family transcriptional regulator [Microbacterium sp. SA39]|uniref:PucR family transcriptional regulator n=1 Tax=Microbacterium sp. SA39 TaxID=1263625 RepID=UPI0005F9BC94|nr:PucR family transcriptional regulator [Microbacterium sp. SA39]KJQ55939.1 carbohydrate diacid transcriptional activator CdaR [Microbacterium sp. SA39]